VIVIEREKLCEYNRVRERKSVIVLEREKSVRAW
jgi:hypothetical protein